MTKEEAIQALGKIIAKRIPTVLVSNAGYRRTLKITQNSKTYRYYTSNSSQTSKNVSKIF